MAEFRGNELVYEWIGTWGTVNLTDQYNSATIDDEADMIDSSGGTIRFREFIPGLRKWGSGYEGMHNRDATPVGGTQFGSVLAPGTFGTLRISPFGTANGAQKFEGAAYIAKRPITIPFDELVTVKIDFQGSGLLTIGSW